MPSEILELFHATTETGFHGIRESGVIRPTWHPRPDDKPLVWLSDRGDGWVRPETAYVFRVTLPRSSVVFWTALPTLSPENQSGLIASARFHRLGDPRTWWVTSEPIYQVDDWAEVVGGEIVWTAD